MAKKFVVAMMMHETNTFSPLPTPIESFARGGGLGALSGPDAIKEAEGTNTTLGGFIEVVAEVFAGHLFEFALGNILFGFFPIDGQNKVFVVLAGIGLF